MASKPVVRRPTKFAHVVLRTNADNFQKMVQFYKDFLGASAAFENDFLSFLSYDDEHHRIAIAGIPGTAPRNPKACGLEHTAFSFDTLEDLLEAYRQRKELGILPIWSVNHGPTTSIYYADPDGNQIETQVDNFETSAEATQFMMSKYFEENPIGTDFDPEEMIEKLRNGVSPEELKKRVEIGPRGILMQ
ncbi:hypothetical protein AYO20_06337 [Fonsecaea nubica]|uniref:VOC domain-containing protein n=1 Tax=Fonsecaea nubica TaxID=856822 RepID=A0A178CZ86_9EURO|nr:hypothetical protein AYO20_06337 [Fonsecaea nubica]OAL34494.1 hypothetical protein AYO20_06337 [Fonsecaea nubica]